MKQIFFLSLFLISFEVSAQFSISAGVQRRKDYFKDATPYFLLNKQSRYLYNLYFISADFQHKKWMYHADVSFLHNDLNFNDKRCENGYYGSHGGYGYIRNYSYEADVIYDYVGLKMGANRVIKANDYFSMLVGGFGQIEMCISEKERNHKTYFTENSFGTKKSSVSENTYDALELINPFISGGLELKPRVSYRQIFVEMNFAAGLFFDSRTYSNMVHTESAYESNHVIKYFKTMKNVNRMRTYNIFFETGLKVGYTFKYK